MRTLFAFASGSPQAVEQQLQQGLPYCGKDSVHVIRGMTHLELPSRQCTRAIPIFFVVVNDSPSPEENTP